MCFARKRIPKHLIIKDTYPNQKRYGIGWLAFAAGILTFSMMVSIAAKAQKVTRETPLYESVNAAHGRAALINKVSH